MMIDEGIYCPEVHDMENYCDLSEIVEALGRHVPSRQFAMQRFVYQVRIFTDRFTLLALRQSLEHSSLDLCVNCSRECTCSAPKILSGLKSDIFLTGRDDMRS